MSLIFMDGFDYQTYDDIVLKWPHARDTTGGQAFGAGRYGGGQCFIAPNFNRSQSYITRHLGQQYVTGIVGFAFKCTAAPANSSYMPSIFVFQDGVANASQISLGLAPGGQLNVYRGTSTIIGTSTAVIPFNTWVYLEIKATIDPTAGAVEVRMNEVTIINVTNVNTRATANTFFSALLLGGNAGYATSGVNQVGSYDDFYFCDTTGTDNNNFLGDVRVETIKPTTVGTRNDFTPNVSFGAHRYWRVYVHESVSGNTPHVSEWQMRETSGGPNVITGGTITASSYYQSNSTYQPSNAIDGSINTGWVGNTGGNQWLQYDFGAGNAKDIREYTLAVGPNNTATNAPYRHALQYSDDGQTWYTLITSLSTGWITSEVRVFTASSPSKMSMIDESPVDVYDANISATPGAKQTYQFSDLNTVSPIVMGVQVVNLVAKDDAGSRTVANIARSGTSEVLSPAQAIASSSMNLLSIHEKDPSTNALWTGAGVNAAEFGIAIVT